MCFQPTTVCVLMAGIITLSMPLPLAFAIDLRPEIDPLVQPLLDDGLVVGMVVGVVQGDQSQVIAYGETTRGSGVQPDADTVYEIGSVSKVFTGVLLADRVQQGLMSLDDPAQKYLPQSVKMPTAQGQPITLKHLATHTSGLPRLPDNIDLSDQTNPYIDYNAELMFAFLNGHALRRPPGVYEYSNLGVGLLGHMIARQSDMTYEQVLIKRICEPLGMADTRMTLDADQLGRLAPPYDASLQLNHNWDFDALAGAGAIRSTCRDMVAFIQANLEDDDQPMTKALRLSHRKQHTMSDGQAIGMGWHIARDGVTRWHNGMTGGYHAWLTVVPSRNVGVVVLTNTASMKVTTLGEQITRAALGREVEPDKRPQTIAVDTDVLATYAGVYDLTPQFRLTVTIEDGRLMVQATGQEAFPVFPESQTKFYYKIVDAQLTFVVSPGGTVSHLVLHQNGVDQKAIRRNQRTQKERPHLPPIHGHGEL
jgi:serine-type D-Ala-D-Ala carboxypeptidase/endopeptidase